MKSNYKRLGDFIRLVDLRNTELKVKTLLGVSIEKKFIPSIANTIGTDMKSYKIVKKGQFAYGTVTSRNGDKVSIALLKDYDECIISSAYLVFEVIDERQLNPDYLMMLFSNPEFDRYARYNSWGSAREVFSWDELCRTEMNIPSIEEQGKIVKQCKTIENRISELEYKNNLLQKLFMIDFKKLHSESKENNLKLCNILNLKRNPIKANDVRDLPYVPIDVLPKNSLLINDYANSSEAQSSLITFEPYDILIGAMRVYFHRVCLSLEKGVTRSTCFVLRPTKQLYKYYSVGLCNLDDTINYASAHSQGTTMPYAVWENGLADMPIKIVEDEEKIENFNKRSFIIFKQIKNNIETIKCLKKMKSLILKMYF